jgi:hypothetical protein
MRNTAKITITLPIASYLKWGRMHMGYVLVNAQTCSINDSGSQSTAALVGHLTTCLKQISLGQYM